MPSSALYQKLYVKENLSCLNIVCIQERVEVQLLTIRYSHGQKYATLVSSQTKDKEHIFLWIKYVVCG